MFEAPKIRSLLPHVHQVRHFGVSYCASRLRANLQRYIDRALDALQAVDLPPRNPVSWSDEQEILFYINAGVYLHAMLHKHEAYRREQEYRFLISGERDNFASYDRHDVRERNREIVGYLKLPIPEWKSRGIQEHVLTHIRIGPAAPEGLMRQIWAALRSSGIPVFGLNLDKSDIPYRSNDPRAI